MFKLFIKNILLKVLSKFLVVKKLLIIKLEFISDFFK